MTRRPKDTIAERSARVLAHLEGSLDAPMRDAMAEVWALLERTAVDGGAHERAVRARMMWQSVASRDDARVASVVPLSAARVEPAPRLADAA